MQWQGGGWKEEGNFLLLTPGGRLQAVALWALLVEPPQTWP
jgi:hypothetical protein